MKFLLQTLAIFFLLFNDRCFRTNMAYFDARNYRLIRRINAAINFANFSVKFYKMV